MNSDWTPAPLELALMKEAKKSGTPFTEKEEEIYKQLLDLEANGKLAGNYIVRSKARQTSTLIDRMIEERMKVEEAHRRIQVILNQSKKKGR